MKLQNGIEYICRLNKGLSLQEISNSLNSLENAKMLPSKDVVKASIRSKPPTARDLFMRMIYDRLRNKKEFDRYTDPQDTHKGGPAPQVHAKGRQSYYGLQQGLIGFREEGQNSGKRGGLRIFFKFY